MKATKRKPQAKTSWYGVKTLFRTAARGKPTSRGQAYDPDVSLIEERVVLFKARGFDAAMRAAEKEARSYARARHINVYGKEVVTRYLGACDAFELFDAPNVLVEVFSTTDVVSKRISDRSVVNARFGRTVNDTADMKRRTN